MFYYVFKVNTNKPEIVPDYYKLNNRYIGYVGFDSQFMRSKLEYHAKVSNKLKYQLFATGSSPDFDEVHNLNVDSKRFSESEIEEFIKKYNFTKTNDDTWYKDYYPIKNCSKCLLKSSDGNRIILNDGLIVTSKEFKKNKKQYLR